MSSEFRHLPSVDRLLSDRRIKRLSQTCSYTLLVDLVRKQLEDARQAISAGSPCPALDEIVAAVSAQLNFLESPSLHPVVNATGVILHTNLGRALLSQEEISAMDAVASGYCNLEYDLGSGKRGSRQVHVEPILCQLSGAEAALVVNNNAAGVLLALTALAKRKEVIVSRGQAVEIGGSFRIPDVMRQSGAKLIEVGTTNCTYIADYEQALSPRTAALMRVHASNFRQIGFIHQASLEELIDLGKRSSVPVFDDLGSGCFLDTTEFGLDPEPMVPQSVSAGAALTLFSGDKLVGGPQAGIIVGRKEYVDKLRRHPLARAVRIDKIRLAGMVATLIHYLKGEALTKIPVWRMVSVPITEIDRRAQLWAQALGSLAQVIDGETMIGGGSLPGGTLPTRLVAIGGQSKSPGRAQGLAQKLRFQKVPVIGRINEDILLLDPRTVLPEEDKIVLGALRDLAAGLK
ncbi:MAG TPA: L-seryl-tRNA(Sec) selenium transferase [Dehalococcoidales bacterium]|nr:L-seryl-tRNA(Sec) selenium transferase [Dehalococcoidales bacterium]